MKYRSEIIFGEGYRDASAVMSHEVFYLQNTDILITLRETILKDSDIKVKLEILEEELNNGAIADGDDGSIYNLIEDEGESDECINFFKAVLEEIQKVTGKDIKYCLWLCNNKNEVYAYDMHKELADADIDSYDETDVILSNMGTDGCLYGYENMPEKILI